MPKDFHCMLVGDFEDASPFGSPKGRKEGEHEGILNKFRENKGILTLEGSGEPLCPIVLDQQSSGGDSWHGRHREGIPLPQSRFQGGPEGLK